MQQEVLIAHVVIGILLIVSILAQDKGTGLSATFGGGGGFYASQRGAAKVIHNITVVLSVLFFLTALLYISIDQIIAMFA
ncbi:MAG: preprotein translocase subunit SecG [Candidatus Gracilibacteria bacterium]|nr:preprotein translocase subunit SecG [Candidatus Gracilibacteria bacterium]